MSDSNAPDSTSAPSIPPITDTAISVRAIITGAFIGGTLSLANIYTGLKIGWGFNMSITAALLAFGFWSVMNAIGVSKNRFTLTENNLNQTGASAAASISSAGLVSAVPALTMLDGHDWGYIELALWIFCCSTLGVFVAVLFRRQMLERDALPYASGIATAETLKEMYARGKEAMARVTALITAAVGAAVWKLVVSIFSISAWRIPWPNLPFSASGAAAKAGISSVPIGKMGMALDPSLLMVGAGMIIGIRIGLWMLIGAVVGWVILGSYVIDQGWVVVENADQLMAVNTWLLWPGVALLVTSSMTSLAFAAPQFASAFRSRGKTEPSPHDFPSKWLWGGIAGLTVLIMIVGKIYFDMSPAISLIAVLLTGVLAIVALRVSGETNVTPVGPMGKVTQLAFGVIDPGNVSTNLMAANITGGAASQAGDMMHDLKTGLMLGNSPKAQAISQFAGVTAGSLVGAAVYLLLIESIGPKLLTPEWAAPAVAQWKAVAELFRDGFEHMPPGAMAAMLWMGIAGVVFVLMEKLLPTKLKKWAPSSSAIGIAFLVGASVSVSFFLGAVLSLFLARFFKNWFMRFGIVVAAGLIAGESITGMIYTIIQAVSGG